MRYLIISVMVIVAFNYSAANADEMYTWEDNNGVHFVDDLYKVPTKYRTQAKKRAGLGSSVSHSQDVKESPPQQSDKKNDTAYANTGNKGTNEASKKALSALKKLWA